MNRRALESPSADRSTCMCTRLSREPPHRASSSPLTSSDAHEVWWSTPVTVDNPQPLLSPPSHCASATPMMTSPRTACRPRRVRRVSGEGRGRRGRAVGRG
eukprot:5494620-Prymnesium_polylepis.1